MVVVGARGVEVRDAGRNGGKQVQVTRCARGSGCLKRRLRRPAEEKGGGGDGGLKVIGGEEGLE